MPVIASDCQVKGRDRYELPYRNKSFEQIKRQDRNCRQINLSTSQPSTTHLHQCVRKQLLPKMDCEPARGTGFGKIAIMDLNSKAHFHYGRRLYYFAISAIGVLGGARNKALSRTDLWNYHLDPKIHEEVGSFLLTAFTGATLCNWSRGAGLRGVGRAPAPYSTGRCW